MSARSVTVFEVGVRDGLQNEPREVPTSLKKWLIRRLVDAGIRELELGAFVRPDRVPRMADTVQIYRDLKSGRLRLGRARPWALVPNRKGLELAVEAGARSIAVFTAASESFNQANIGMSVKESLQVHADVIGEAKRRRMKVRGYVSTVFGCPYEGKIQARKALKVIDSLAALGVDQLSIGDTIGVADPRGVEAVVKPALASLGPKKAAVHFHDTRGTALANTLRSLDIGVRIIDSSAGGLGGCPFAPGATGNLATEDLIFMLDGMGVRTGIDLEKLAHASIEFASRIGRPLSSRYLQAFAAECGLRPASKKRASR